LGKLGEWVVRHEKLVESGTHLWVEHPAAGRAIDVVALPLLQLDDVELFPYALSGGPDIAVSPAEPVSVVGFPFGLTAGGSLAVWATGFVASELDVNFQGQPKFLVDCRTRPGQSGSAVIAHRNGGAVAMADGNTGIFGGPITKFLGVYSGRVSDQSDLGIVWKVECVEQIIAVV